MSSSSNGMFREELPQQFLSVMAKAGWDYIKHIYSKVLARYTSHTDKHFTRVFIECLCSVKSWCPQTKYEELTRLKKLYPYLTHLYECTYLSAMTDFCRLVDNSDFKKRRVVIPIFDDFFVLFLTKLSDSEYVQNLSILKYTYDQLLVLIAMLLRSAFFDCIQFISIPALEYNSAPPPAFQSKPPYESDVASILSLTEDNLKWHNKTIGLDQAQYTVDQQEIAQTIDDAQSVASEKTTVTLMPAVPAVPPVAPAVPPVAPDVPPPPPAVPSVVPPRVMVDQKIILRPIIKKN
jgi:hypothetical protein